MKVVIALIGGLWLLSGCASHQELKAPCGPLSFAADDGCGAERPINIGW